MKEKLYPKHAHTIRAESIEEFRQQVADLNELVNGERTEVRVGSCTEIVNHTLEKTVETVAALTPEPAEIKTEGVGVHINTGGVVASASDTDIDGIPWDARIHASSKAKTSSGKWRERRNLDPVVKAQVTAELFSKVKQVETVAAPSIQIPQPSAPTVHVEMPTMRQPPQPEPAQERSYAVNHPRGQFNLSQAQYDRFKAGESLDVILGFIEPPAPAPQIPPPAATAGNTPQYEFNYFQKNLAVVLSDLFNQQRVTPNYLGQLAQRFGVDSLWMVMTDREKSIELFNQLVMDNVIRQVSF